MRPERLSILGQPAAAIFLVGTLWACGSPTGPEEETRPPPPPGPHFTVFPIPLETLATITPVGFNNKRFPTPHTYWETCDRGPVLPTHYPCHMERQDIRVPMNARVRDLDPSADGYIVFEGFPGLTFHFGHVTPAAGLAAGSTVTAGQVVARMFYEHGFDFGLVNYGIEHRYVVPERYHDGYRHAEHPIAQFPEGMRAQLLTRVNSLSATPLGRLAFDVDGTAAGGWFLEGAPSTALNVGSERYLLWLARYVERDDTRIASFGEAWAGMQNWLLAADAAAPDWEAVTPTSGIVAVRLWNVGNDARPNPQWAAGTLLVHMLDGRRLRMEWFDTHDPVGGFTAAAKVFVR